MPTDDFRLFNDRGQLRTRELQRQADEFRRRQQYLPSCQMLQTSAGESIVPPVPVPVPPDPFISVGAVDPGIFDPPPFTLLHIGVLNFDEASGLALAGASGQPGMPGTAVVVLQGATHQHNGVVTTADDQYLGSGRKAVDSLVLPQTAGTIQGSDPLLAATTAIGGSPVLKPQTTALLVTSHDLSQGAGLLVIGGIDAFQIHASVSSATSHQGGFWCNFKQGLTVNVPYTKSDGTTGTLTFTGGILTGQT